jgi:hypothetical protein
LIAANKAKREEKAAAWNRKKGERARIAEMKE